MSESQNVKIPLSLFNNIMSFFNYLNITDYCPPSIYKYKEMLEELNKKQHSINLRTVYTRMVYAKDENQRDSTRADYLYLKQKYLL